MADGLVFIAGIGRPDYVEASLECDLASWLILVSPKAEALYPQTWFPGGARRCHQRECFSGKEFKHVLVPPKPYLRGPAATGGSQSRASSGPCARIVPGLPANQLGAGLNLRCAAMFHFLDPLVERSWIAANSARRQTASRHVEAFE